MGLGEWFFFSIVGRAGGGERRKHAGWLIEFGRDGHYGLWLNDNLEKGVSDSCPTFGNEPLSDEGTKFGVLGVELWYLGAE